MRIPACVATGTPARRVESAHRWRRSRDRRRRCDRGYRCLHTAQPSHLVAIALDARDLPAKKFNECFARQAFVAAKLLRIILELHRRAQCIEHQLAEPRDRDIWSRCRLLPRFEKDRQVFVFAQTESVQRGNDCGSCSPDRSIVLDDTKQLTALQCSTGIHGQRHMLVDTTEQCSWLEDGEKSTG